MVSTTLFCSFSLTGLDRLITRETVAIEHPLFFAINLISIFAIFKIPPEEFYGYILQENVYISIVKYLQN